MLRSALFLLLFMFSMLVISCDPTEIVEPDLINFGFTEDYTNTLQIQAHTAYVSLPYGSTLTSLQINGDVLWGPDFVINGDHSVIYQFDTIYSTHNGMGVYRDTTSYVLTLGDAVYSGTLIKPDYPQLQLLALDMQEDYHFTPNNALETPPKRKVLHIFTYHNDLRSSTKPNQGWRIICNRVNQARASKRVKSKLSLAQN